MEWSLLVKPNQNGGHVVAAKAGHGVLGEEFAEKFLHDGPIAFSLTNFLLNNIYESLAIVNVFLPNTVASYNNELVFVDVALYFLNVRLCCDHLLVPF